MNRPKKREVTASGKRLRRVLCGAGAVTLLAARPAAAAPAVTVTPSSSLRDGQTVEVSSSGNLCTPHLPLGFDCYGALILQCDSPGPLPLTTVGDHCLTVGYGPGAGTGLLEVNWGAFEVQVVVRKSFTTRSGTTVTCKDNCFIDVVTGIQTDLNGFGLDWGSASIHMK